MAKTTENSQSLIITSLSFFTFSCFALSTPSNSTDFLSLLSLKAAIDDPQGALNSWNETSQIFCSWTGIRCGGRRHPDRVIAITLRSKGLVGPLSPHIGNLSFLRGINLQNNTFHGPIPQEVFFLRRLEFVEFSNNSFSGPIPRNLSRSKNLAYLNLIDNNLSGAIPLELGALYSLQALGLGSNTLSPGPIPPFIGNLTSLRRLGLRFCNLRGEIPESFTQLQSLELLSLSDNSLTGMVPSGVFNISTLIILELSLNQLQGTIPSTVGLTMGNLEVLHLANNQFTGVVPVTLSNATSLEEIIFLDNYFTGPMPRQLGRLSRLIQFGFAVNPIRDDISFITSLTNCTSLRRLEIGQNFLSGSLPDSISNLSSQLASLVISSTDVHGVIPSGIGNLVSLDRFSLGNNNLEGPIPAGIGKLSNLHRLNLGKNRFTNALPFSLGNLSFLNDLYLDRNNFSGTIPKSMGNCTNLLDLDLSQNNLNGSIPREILSLSTISISLNLSYNSLTDSIPVEVGSLTNLAHLDLSNNRLSGSIPNSLSTCRILQLLHLEGNSFEGQIPQGLSDLMGLVDLDLSQNSLSGPIPSFLTELHLKKLNLSFNRLQGEVPVLGVFRNRTTISLEGNKRLCGGIPELKLPPCTSPNSYKKILKIAIPAAGVAALVLCIVIVIYKRRTPKENLLPLPSFVDAQILRLSYADLLKATQGFSNTNLIGVGRFGSVYKGILYSGQILVAVKVLNLAVKGASKSFMAECNALKLIRHRNLVRILSACESVDFQGNDFKALIYEFKAHGSLEKWLYNNPDQGEQLVEIKSLSIIQRLNIAIEIAEALEYLHFGTDSTIVHGDLKPSNILLDHDMTACVGDFGLAKIITDIAPPHESSSSFGIKGTIGYIPPEYGTSRSISTQGDAYSYGILVLEMFTNRRPTDALFKDDINLHNFVSAVLPNRVTEIVDPFIQIGCGAPISKIKDCMASVLSIGVSCSKTMPMDRMSMTNVVNELHKIRNNFLAEEHN